MKPKSPATWIIFCLICSILFMGCEKKDSRGVGVDTRTDPLPANTESLGEYHALIIGIDDYQKWPELQFAHQDAEDIRDILTERYQFEKENVSFLGNSEASLRNIVSVLTNLLTKLTENDNLLVYYAGHGQLDPLTGSGYWIPVDGDAYDETSWIRFSAITEKITAKAVKVKNILLITDSCYGGALTRSGPTPGKANPDDLGEQQYLAALSRIVDKPSRQVVASGGFEEVPDQSVFAGILKRNLRENTLPMIDVEYMFFKNVMPQLIQIGTQRPRISKLASGLDIDGQFIFALRNSDLVVDHKNPDTDSDSGNSETTEETDPDRGETNTTGTNGDIVTNGSSEGDENNSNDDNQTSQNNDQTPEETTPVVTPPAGQMVTISWETQNAIGVTLDGSSVALNGATRILLPDSRAVVLNAVNPDGKLVSSTLNVAVVHPKPVIKDFVVSTSTIVSGKSTKLKWATDKADEVLIKGIGKVDKNGTVAVSPKTTTTYEIIAKNKAGSTSRKITINVNQAKPQIRSFSAKPNKVVSGTATTVIWSTQNAKKVTINGAEVKHSGKKQFRPKKTTDYVLIAISADGQKVRKNLRITVAPILRPPTDLRIENINPAINNIKPMIATLATKVTASGKSTIKQTWSADLDINNAPSGNGADIWFQARTANDRFVTPKGGATLAHMGSKAPTVAVCKKAKLGSGSINIKQLKTGDYLCVKTNKNQFSSIKITALPAPRVGNLGIQFTTWK